MTFTLRMIKTIIALAKDIDLSTKNAFDDITSKGSKVLIGYGSFCNRKKPMTVSDNTIQAEDFGDFFKDLGKKRHNV